MSSINPQPHLIDGVDVPGVAEAVRACPGVADLDEGLAGSVVSYLPGSRVPGVRVDAERVTVQIRAQWGVPVAELGRHVRAAVSPLVGGRTVDVVVSDIDTPASDGADSPGAG
ncbi:Asp23/Gls24 family envelope stress response protein [uncultured Jatrophihabitans sp.]|uniref:Asp23/Gls24 family envelope stress response protein n=1 Tax=uncultured Jatrophihabitans sp. TaxID=1610747 RepID=UPI0035CA7D08